MANIIVTFIVLDNKTRRNVNRAISSLYAMTCVEFRPAEIGDNSIIMFKNGSKCSSFIGRKKGISKVRIFISI